MYITLSKASRRLSYLFQRIADLLYTSPEAVLHQQWVTINGDKTLRINYDLSSESCVFDIGGFEGQWASDVYAKYRCRIYIFEPVPQFSANIETRFNMNPSISVHHFGLSNQTIDCEISVNADSSSTFITSKNNKRIILVKAEDFINSINIERINLMKINIEGGEYDLLDHLISVGLVNRIDNIQVQFHRFVSNADARMEQIQKKLSLTHRLSYQYKYIWENWEKIK